MATVERLTGGQLMFLRLMAEPDACLCQGGETWGVELVGNDAVVKVLPEHGEWARDRGYVTRLHPESHVEPLRYVLSELGWGLVT